jgi:hypothetical protein
MGLQARRTMAVLASKRGGRNNTMPTHPVDEPLRVIKTLRPLQPGTLKHMQRFGEALLCVRYRESKDRSMRHTTVELIVETNPTRSRGHDKQMVEVRIEWREATLRARAKALGAQLDKQTALWHMPFRAARILGLIDRIVPA